MNFLLCGDKNAPPLLLIHGLGSCAERCYLSLARALGRKYRVIMACLDGHDPYIESTFESISVCCEKIERFIIRRFGGSVYGISGFSLGGTVALELVKRGVISAKCLHLDAALCTGLGIMSVPYTLYFTKGFGILNMGIKLPGLLNEFLFGKGNADADRLFDTDISSETMTNACRDFFAFPLSPRLRGCGARVEYWCGSNETYAKKSARALEEYFPGMRVRVFNGLGHGQMLREHKKAYLRKLRAFLADSKQA